MKVTHIIKSKSYNSDGRLLKWIASLVHNNIGTDVFYLEDDNKKGVRYEDNIKIESTHLKSRNLFRKRKGYILKIPEYCVRTINHINKCKSDVLVFHDVQQYLNIYITLVLKRAKNKMLVWDLHELPHSIFFKSIITRRILKFLIEGVDVVVYTNVERRDYIYERIKMKETKYFILNNYPNENYLIQGKNDLPLSLKNNNFIKPYVLWLGGAWNTRNFTPFLEAYKMISNYYNLVILGNIEDEYKKEINELIKDNKAFNSFVKQEEIIKYIDNAYLSVALYKANSPNNFYCEPNRLYQLLTRNIPSIVGNNPTMKRVVEKYKGGIVLSDDGSDVDMMKDAMLNLIDASVHKEIVENLENSSIKVDLNWDNQIITIINYIQKK